MKRRCAALLAIALLVNVTGCKKHGKKKGKFREASRSTQILREFKMQEIVDGEKNMVLESMEGRLVEQETVAEMDHPRVTFYEKGDESSVLTAPSGRVRMDTHEVNAWGGVTVVTPDSATLNTAQLRYDPKRDRLISDDPIRLEKPDSITVGVGLEATTDLSRVRIGHQKVYVKSKRN